MKLMSFFRKPSVALAMGLLIFTVSCSQNSESEDVLISGTTEKSSHEEFIRFSIQDYADNVQLGYLRLGSGGQVVVFGMDLTNAVAYNSLTQIDNDNLIIKGISGNVDLDVAINFNKDITANST